jgi:hypothetical protein
LYGFGSEGQPLLLDVATEMIKRSTQPLLPEGAAMAEVIVVGNERWSRFEFNTLSIEGCRVTRVDASK